MNIHKKRGRNGLTNLVIVSDFIAANSWRLCEKSSISNFPEADFSLSSTNSSNCPICTRSRGSSSLKETFEAEKRQRKKKSMLKKKKKEKKF